MQHRYIVWTGHYRGRRFEEMHIIDHENKPICKMWRSQSTEYEAIYQGRPASYPLCRNCSRERAAFEEAERLRVWQGMTE